MRPGPALLVVILVADQLTKGLALDALGGGRIIEVTAFFQLLLVWNTGISFGMLRGVGDWGPLLLTAATLLIGAGLALWLRREPRSIPRLALWGILAGALGNLIDRLRYGAVVDFLDFHLAGYHWPAFNIADSAIVVGACLLILDGFVWSRSSLGDAREKG